MESKDDDVDRIEHCVKTDTGTYRPSRYFPTALIPRVFILLNGWICLHGVLD